MENRHWLAYYQRLGDTFVSCQSLIDFFFSLAQYSYIVAIYKLRSRSIYISPSHQVQQELLFILLIYTVQKISRQGCRVLFIKCQNKLRVFIRLNSITKYLNNLYQIQNIVSYLSPFIIQRRLNIQIISSFIQIRALLSQFSVSQINGIGYQFLIVWEGTTSL